jgi:hypothetical protein
MNDEFKGSERKRSDLIEELFRLFLGGTEERESPEYETRWLPLHDPIGYAVL